MPTHPSCLFLSSDEWSIAIASILTEDKRRGVEMMPAFTLQDIIEVLPKEMKTSTDTYWLTMSHDSEEWYICYSMSDEFDTTKNLSLIHCSKPHIICSVGAQRTDI